MLCFPNCKINLGLYVTRKRADGYHDLETVFYPVSSPAATASSGMVLHDVLEIVPATTSQLHMSGLPVQGSASDNLVLKAYNLLKAKFPTVIAGLDIYLHKTIPMGAGLGGGSANGAYMLLLLNDFFSLGLSKPDLAGLALQLGSDCPFFIYNTPQFATGRGEKTTGLTLDLSDYSIQVICPQVHVSTAGAFAMITPAPAPFNLMQLPLLPIDQWKDKITNDFEQPVFQQHPALSDIKQQLYLSGAIYASMSGSGSSIYAIFEKGHKAAINTTVGFTSYYIP